MAVTYFGRASTPSDNGSQAGPTVAVTPPGSMQAGDLVLMVAHVRRSSGTLTVSTTGGQSWTSETQVNQSTNRTRLFWCVFNGTWAANPACQTSSGTTEGMTVDMTVFRPDATVNSFAANVAASAAGFAAPSTPFDVSRAGVAPTADGCVVFAYWCSQDDNTWALQTGGGWTNPGGVTQVRNTSGSDLSTSVAYLIQTTAGATGAVVNRQTALGGDAGVAGIVAFEQRDTRMALALTGSATMEAALLGQAGSSGNGVTRAGSPRRRLRPMVLRAPASAAVAAAEFEGALAGSATVAAALTTSITAAAALSTTASMAGDLSTDITAAAALTGSAAVGADLDTDITAAGALSATASMVGDLSTAITAAAALSASGTLAGDLSTEITFAAALDGTGTVAADLEAGAIPDEFTADLTGTATLAADLNTEITFGAALAGTATLAADLLTADAPVAGVPPKGTRSRADFLLRFREEQDAGATDNDAGEDAGPPAPLVPASPVPGSVNAPDAVITHVSRETPQAPPDILGPAPTFEFIEVEGWDDEADAEELLTLLALGGVV